MPAFRKKLISRDVKKKEIDIVSRRGQPQVAAAVPILKKQDVPETPVSSSWISHLAYNKKDNIAKMGTYDKRTGITRDYEVKLPMSVFAGWYYAHSKGTYFNENIRGKFPLRRLV